MGLVLRTSLPDLELLGVKWRTWTWTLEEGGKPLAVRTENSAVPFSGLMLLPPPVVENREPMLAVRAWGEAVGVVGCWPLGSERAVERVGVSMEGKGRSPSADLALPLMEDWPSSMVCLSLEPLKPWRMKVAPFMTPPPTAPPTFPTPLTGAPRTLPAGPMVPENVEEP